MHMKKRKSLFLLSLLTGLLLTGCGCNGKVKVDSIKLDKPALNMELGGEAGELTATVVPAQGVKLNDQEKEFSISVADSAIASVSATSGVSGVSFKVSPLALGQTTLEVKSLVGSKTASCTINVTEPEVLVEVDTYLVLSPVGLYKGNKGENFADLHLENAVKFHALPGTDLPGSDDVTTTSGATFKEWVAYEGEGAPTVYTKVPNKKNSILYAMFEGGEGTGGDNQGGGGTDPLPTDPTTYYFSNNKGWSNVNVYAFNDDGSDSADWPGKASVFMGYNSYFEKLYKVTIPAGFSKFILNNTVDQQTVDLLVSDYPNGKGLYLTDLVDGKYNIGSYDFNSTEEVTNYFCLGKDGLYEGAKGQDYTEPECTNAVKITAAPGSKLPGADKVTSETLGKFLYWTTSPTSTVEIDRMPYGSGAVLYALFANSDTDVETPVPGESISVYFEDSNHWKTVNYYTWHKAGSVDTPKASWPGEAMTYVGLSENYHPVYVATFPDTFNYLIFNNGNKQSADISLSGVANKSIFTINQQVDANGYFKGDFKPFTVQEEAKVILDLSEGGLYQGHAGSVVGSVTNGIELTLPVASALPGKDKITSTNASRGEFSHWALKADSIDAVTEVPLTDAAVTLVAVFENDDVVIPVVEKLTYYFTNNLKWKNVAAYVWGGDEGILASWPGSPMTLVGTDREGNEVYSFTFNKGAHDSIIFSGSGGQTVDISLTGVPSGTGYKCGDKTENNYNVISYTFDPSAITPNA